MNQFLKQKTSIDCECCLSLADFQWRFVVSSLQSNLKDNSAALIQLKLILQDPCAISKRRIIILQMSISQFKDFYKQMQTINNMLSIVR